MSNSNKNSEYSSPLPKRSITHFIYNNSELLELLNDSNIPNYDYVVYWPYEAQPQSPNDLDRIKVQNYRNQFNISI